MKSICLFSCLCLMLAVVESRGNAQSAYSIPFASQGNIIELSIANISSTTAGSVSIQVTNVPSWMRFDDVERQIPTVTGGGEGTVAFSFSIEKSAPVDREHTLRFVITSSTGENWTKEITVAVAAPEQFELFQNYPNPFNPTTAIGYQLSATSRVSLKVFDVLGREVATLVDGDRPAGYHEERWDAGAFASGMYVYELVALAGNGKRHVGRRTLMLVR